jgi:hypothetical protein
MASMGYSAHLLAQQPAVPTLSDAQRKARFGVYGAGGEAAGSSGGGRRRGRFGGGGAAAGGLAFGAARHPFASKKIRAWARKKARAAAGGRGGRRGRGR